MEDIGKVLYERVKANFDRRCKDHYLIKTISKRIANGKADMIDLSSYAGSLGAQLANAILDEVTQDLLPDGRLYYNIAKSIIEPMLRGNYDLINSVADELQASLDRKLSYRIKAQHAPFPQERVNTAIGAASQEGIDWEMVRRRMSSTPENITHAMADDYMKANAEFRSKAGMETYIERRDDGKCCEWCSKLAGRYRYPEQVPRDVFRRHDNCGCLVSYVTPGGMRQNVWTKKWQEPEGAIKDKLSSLNKVLTKQDNNAKIDIVESALGISKSAPMSIENAVKGANPNYNVDRKYRVNCQRCVQAYELRRRGYNVEALPKPKGRSYISWGNECFIDSKTVLSGRADSFFEMRRYKQDIFDKLANSPDGSRHVIYAQWKRGGAHVFVAEKENGVIKFVDPQSGKMDCSSHFDKAVDGKYGIFRLDDKDLTDNSNILKKTVKGS